MGTPTKHIKRLDVNGLNGRILSLPKPRRTSHTVLVIYDYNSSLEQVFPIAKYLSYQMGVLAPDLPGIGGMDSLFKLGMHTDSETLADYIASIIKLHFGRQKFVLAGIGYGFAVAEELLHKYPAIAQRVEFVICLAGITETSELNISFARKQTQRFLSNTMRKQLPVTLAQGIGQVFNKRHDAAARLQLKHDLMHLTHNGKKSTKSVYYFPAQLDLPIDQTKVAANLKKTYRRVVVATDIEITNIDSQLFFKPLRSDARFPWMSRRQKSLKQAVLNSQQEKTPPKPLKLPAEA